MTENKTKWQQLKEASEMGGKEDKLAFEDLKQAARIGRKATYKKEKSFSPGERPHSLKKAMESKKEHFERNKIKSDIWKAENREYLNLYNQLKSRGYFFNKKIYLRWLAGGSDENSYLLKLDPVNFPIQREEF